MTFIIFIDACGQIFYSTNMLITREQIRGARAMLEMTLEALSNKSTVPISTLTKIEKGIIEQSRESTLKKIQTALEESGLEFINKGVRFKQNIIQIFDGADAFNKIQDDILYTLKDTGGEVLYKFSDESFATDISTQKDIMLRQHGIKMRFLIKNGDTNLMFPLKEYRQVSKKYFKDNLQIIYGDKFATIIGGHHHINQLKILLVHDKTLADINRNDFNLYWDNGQIPFETTSEVQHD